MDQVCFEYIQEVAQKLPDSVLSYTIGATINDRDGQYDWITHTITIHPKVCSKPRFFLKWVVLHEIGHHIAVAAGDTSEEGADYYARVWYGEANELANHAQEQCLSRSSKLYCYLQNTFGKGK